MSGTASPAVPHAPHGGPFAALDPCVHCGFCLPACPTYLATGDEADSPRGRIVLMRALERGELDPRDPALTQHLDACLGCRGCEPACPSGVGYGRGLESARRILAERRGIPLPVRLFLATIAHRPLWRAMFGLAGFLRETGLARLLAGPGRLGFAMAMVESTRPVRCHLPAPGADRPAPASRPVRRGAAGTVALFRGCVMDTLFHHVNEATKRTLEANGYLVVEVPSQVCCGALHEHASHVEGARALARRNVRALLGKTDYVVVNSAGCGAVLKDYGHLLGTTDGAEFGTRVKDVSELLALQGPRPGGPLPVDVAYDAPCHLQHAQKVHAPVLQVLKAIPELRLQLLPGHDRCCGRAGIYSMLEPGMSRAVLDDKLRTIREAPVAPRVMATGNPGCHMQIGAGLRGAGLGACVAHPVELLDWSYEAGGLYG